ncbi:hypothetical protein [Sphaerisporangium aureirubrum]|uniref:Uncharacterized protein n=1 Tax=Sphaerisporangium aureirubrum TaxID=1544736 RepID=A0ABW1NCG3_9ACTN
MITIHVAGEPQMGGLYQQCARCGHVLQDFTGSQPMVPEGQDSAIPYWTPGRPVAVDGNRTWLVADRDRGPLGGEAECEPDKAAIPGWEGAAGPFPSQYRRPHVYARDIHSGAGNCVCHRPLGDARHVQAAPGVPIPDDMRP